MGNFMAMITFLNFLNDPFMSTQTKMLYIVGGILLFIGLILIVKLILGGKEGFIGSDMWYGYNFHDSNKTSKEDRTKSLVKISKGYLPGERPKEGGLLENFENVYDPYNPRNYEIEPDYHRTVQQFGVDPNPVESLETPEFMIPKTYRTEDKYEKIAEVDDNSIDAIRLRQIESTFQNVEKNKYYSDLLQSKCRAGNRSSHKNCGCKAPMFGEH